MSILLKKITSIVVLNKIITCEGRFHISIINSFKDMLQYVNSNQRIILIKFIISMKQSEMYAIGNNH